MLDIVSPVCNNKTMERDFWSGNHPLGHMPLLVSPEKDDDMTTLCATGKSNLDDVTPMYLWSYGNYRYEIEVKNSYFSECEVFETSYEDALKKFENMVDKVVLV